MKEAFMAGVFRNIFAGLCGIMLISLFVVGSWFSFARNLLMIDFISSSPSFIPAYY